MDRWTAVGVLVSLAIAAMLGALLGSTLGAEPVRGEPEPDAAWWAEGLVTFAEECRESCEIARLDFVRIEFGGDEVCVCAPAGEQ